MSHHDQWSLITKIINFYTEFIFLLTGVNWWHGNKKCSMNGKKSSKRNCCDHRLGSIFLSWHIFSPWQNYLHPFLHEPDDNRHCNCCMKAKKKFTWQWIFLLNVSVQKVIGSCLFDRGKRWSNKEFIESITIKINSRKRAAEVLSYATLRTPWGCRWWVLSTLISIKGDYADDEWWWPIPSTYFRAFTWWVGELATFFGFLCPSGCFQGELSWWWKPGGK